MTTLITGSDGLIGTALRSCEITDAYFATRKDADLVNREEVMEMFNSVRPSRVIHLAAQVAGIGGNIMSSADYFRNNILMNTHTLEAAKRFKVSKLVSIMSTCVFPEKGPFPLRAEHMHDGPPHQSNFGYAYAKRMLDVQSRAYRRQYGSNFITAIPCNVYGPNDNYNLIEGHVIPSLIHKFYLAKNHGQPLLIWGDGSPRREFIYSMDVAKVLLWMLENYEEDFPLIVAPRKDVSIRELAVSLAREFNYEGELVFDSTKPNGQPKKPSDSSLFHDLCTNLNLTELGDGLRESVRFFVSNYPKLRGVHE